MEKEQLDSPFLQQTGNNEKEATPFRSYSPPTIIKILDLGGTITAERNQLGVLENIENSNKFQTKLGEFNARLALEKPYTIVYEKGEGLIKDSSERRVADWTLINQKLATLFFDKTIAGIVVTHGTDTLAYTASAITFGNKYITMPVVVTAAQFPLFELYTDARMNLIGACDAAYHCPPEVFVFMNHKLMMGTRIMKFDASDIDSFDTPTATLVGRYSDKLHFDRKLVRDLYWRKIGDILHSFQNHHSNDLFPFTLYFLKNDSDHHTLNEYHCSNQVDLSLLELSERGFTFSDLHSKKELKIALTAALLKDDSGLRDFPSSFFPINLFLWAQLRSQICDRFSQGISDQSLSASPIRFVNEFIEARLCFLYPGLTEEQFEYSVNSSAHKDRLYSGVLIVAYGSGNGLAFCKKIMRKYNRTLFAVCSVCPAGYVGNRYAAGLLADLEGSISNVVSCGDMTTETAYVKLCWVLARMNVLSQSSDPLICDVHNVIATGVRDMSFSFYDEIRKR